MVSDSKTSTGFYDFVAWLEVNKKRLIVAAVIVAVAGFGTLVYFWYEDQREEAGDEALMSLRTSQSGSEENRSEAAAFVAVAKQYPGTPAGERALLLGAGAYFESGNYAEAERVFSQFLKEHPSSPLAPEAAYGAAAALEAEGKTDAALAAYRDVTVKYPSSSVVSSARLAIARIDVAKKQFAAALRIYDELAPMSSRRESEAFFLREDLLAKHPELGATNAPPASAAAGVGATNRLALPPRVTNAALPPRVTNAASSPIRPSAARAPRGPVSQSRTNKLKP